MCYRHKLLQRRVWWDLNEPECGAKSIWQNWPLTPHWFVMGVLCIFTTCRQLDSSVASLMFPCVRSCLNTFRPPAERPGVWWLWWPFLSLRLALRRHPPLALHSARCLCLPPSFPFCLQDKHQVSPVVSVWLSSCLSSSCFCLVLTWIFSSSGGGGDGLRWPTPAAWFLLGLLLIFLRRRRLDLQTLRGAKSRAALSDWLWLEKTWAQCDVGKWRWKKMFAGDGCGFAPACLPTYVIRFLLLAVLLDLVLTLCVTHWRGTNWENQWPH